MNPLETHRKIVAGTRRANPAVSFGVNFAAGMGLCAILGWKLDQRRGPDALGFTVAGVVLGFIYGGYELWKIVRADAEGEAGPGPPPAPDRKEGA